MAQADGGRSVSRPDLPDVARTIIKGVIVALANGGFITDAAAQELIALIGLADA